MIKKYSVYPRYKLLELHTLYKSILHYCDSDPQRFLQGLESALNFQKIMIKSEIIDKSIFENKTLDFKTFIEIYKKFEGLMFIQSVTDYIEIIFECHSKKRLNFQSIYGVLSKRSSKVDALEITDLLFRKLALDRE